MQATLWSGKLCICSQAGQSSRGRWTSTICGKLDWQVFVQLFSAFDIFGGCRKLTVSYNCDDDATGCLPLYAYKRRVSDGRVSSRRCTNISAARIALISVAAIMLFLLLLFIGHPSSKVTLTPRMLHTEFRNEASQILLNLLLVQHI